MQVALIAASYCAGHDLVSGGGGCIYVAMGTSRTGATLRIWNRIGLDWPAWRHSVADRYMNRYSGGTGKEHLANRYVYTKASANRWYDEVRKQNDATTLLGSSIPLHALHGIPFIVLLRTPAMLEDCTCDDHEDK